MGKSLNLGTIAGIRLQVHWTFSLIIAWILLTSFFAGENLFRALYNVAFVLVLFCCVLLHELGHALAARLYGIPTRDITLLPIGGVARLERMPRKPSQELVVALAGPAVNVVIAGVLFLVLTPVVRLSSLSLLPTGTGTFLQQLMLVNIALVVFNLLPAFPMDGGRVLRAMLAMFLNYVTATRVAALIGQLCAVGFVFLGFSNPMLFLIAAFIFFAASTEAQQVAIREQLAGYRVRDGMLRQFQVVPADGAIRQFVPELLETQQSEFPVIRNGLLVGMARLDRALDGLQNGSAETFGDIMQPDVFPLEENESLTSTIERTATGKTNALPVISNGVLVGLLDFTRVFDLLRARARFNRQPQFTSAPDPQYSSLTA